MIDKIVENTNNKNSKIAKDLVDLLIDNNIKSLEELIKFEDNLFTLDGKTLNTKERIDYCYNLSRLNPFGFAELDFKESIYVSKLTKQLKEDYSEIEKINKLIELFALTGREMFFPVEAYRYIVNENN